MLKDIVLQKNLYFWAIVIFIIGLIISIPHLETRDVETWDESTNALVVYQTYDTENTFALQFEGDDFLEKPPLWYIVTSWSVKYFGFNLFSLRIISAVSFSLLGTMIFLFLHRETKLISLSTLGSLFLYSTRHLIIHHPNQIFSSHSARSADVDLLFILFIFVSFFFLSGEKKQYNIILGSIFSALAFLTKGPLALIPPFVFIILNFKNLFTSPKKLIAPFVVFSLITIPWHLWMYSRLGGKFIDVYFFYHMLSRIGLTVENHHGSLWFYLEIISQFTVYLWFFPSLIATIFLLRKSPTHNTLFVIVLSGLFFLVPTLSQTKLAWYILPLYPFFILTIPLGISKVKSNRFILTFGFFILASLQILHIIYQLNSDNLNPMTTLFKTAKAECTLVKYIPFPSIEQRLVHYYLTRYEIAETQEYPYTCIIHESDFVYNNFQTISTFETLSLSKAINESSPK